MERRPKDSALSINIRGNRIRGGPRHQQCPDAFQPALLCRGEQRGLPDLPRALGHYLEHLCVRTHIQQELDDAGVLTGYGDMTCRADYSALALHFIRRDTWLGPRVQKYSHDLKVPFVHSRVQGGRDDMTVSVFAVTTALGSAPDRSRSRTTAGSPSLMAACNATSRSASSSCRSGFSSSPPMT